MGRWHWSAPQVPELAFFRATECRSPPGQRVQPSRPCLRRHRTSRGGGVHSGHRPFVQPKPAQQGWTEAPVLGPQTPPPPCSQHMSPLPGLEGLPSPEAVCCLRPLPWAWGTEDVGARLTMVLSSQGQRGGPGREGGRSRGPRAGDPGPELWLQRREARCPLCCGADGVRRPCPHVWGKTVRPGAGGHVDLGSAGGGAGGGGGRVRVSGGPGPVPHGLRAAAGGRGGAPAQPV